MGAMSEKGRELARAVRLFHSGSPWSEEKALEWQRLSASIFGDGLVYDATTKTLCNMARAVLGLPQEEHPS